MKYNFDDTLILDVESNSINLSINHFLIENKADTTTLDLKVKDYIENTKWDNESLINLINIGWIYASEAGKNDEAFRKNIIRSIRNILERENIEFSPDCKSLFLYRLIFYIEIDDSYNVNLILKELIHNAIVENTHIYWVYLKNDEKYVNWGISHGIIGIISLLEKCIKKKLVEEQIFLPILKKVITTYLFFSDYNKQKLLLNTKKEIDYFPFFGYCYGLLANLLILHRCSKIIYDKKLENETVELIDILAKIEPDKKKFENHYICHGYTGTALIFLICAHDLKNKKFNEVSKKWISITKKAIEKKQNSINFLKFDKSNLDESILFGLPGILLVFKAIDLNIRENWITTLGF